MSVRILLTGFKPFGSLTANPTEQLMRALETPGEECPAAEIETAVLDVDYLLAETQFQEAVTRFAPDAILSFGVNGGTDQLCLERAALNLDDAALPDGAGLKRQGTPIIERGPVGYWATLDLEALHAALVAAGLPVRFSNHAGTYLCNHLFYYALHLIRERGLQTPVGFVHVPPLPEQTVEGSRAQEGMALETLVEAARVCISAIALALVGDPVCSGARLAG